MASSPSAADCALYDVSDHVATLTLNRPDKLNALSAELMERIVQAIERAKRDDGVRVLLLTGAGRAFCSGADIGPTNAAAAPNGVPPADEMTAVASKARLQGGLQRIPLALEDFGKPIIAAVNGIAAGAGLDLALMADIRVAGESARMAESYARLGLVPGGGGAWFLPRVVGTARALQMLWTAEFVSAAEALQAGLVNSVFPDGDLMAQAHELARKIAAMPPLSISYIKRAVYQGLHTDLKTGLELISSFVAIVRSSRDQAEARAAFRDKRPGIYEGR